LEVAGQVKITGGGFGAGKVLTSDTTGLATWQPPLPSGSANQTLRCTGGTNWTANSLIYNNGTNVGIGTTSPSPEAKLEVAGNVKVSGTGNGIIFPNGTKQTTAASVGGGADSDWIISGNDMYSGVSGNVGIGTDSPSETLDVVASSGDTAIMASYTGNNMGYGVYAIGTQAGVCSSSKCWGVYGSSTSGEGVRGRSDYGYAGYFYGPKNYFSGNVGIGTETPGARLHINPLSGSANIALANSELTDNYDGILHIRSGGYVVSFDGSDNVGIGTTSPSCKLDVDGTARLRGIQDGSGATVVVDDDGILYFEWGDRSSKRYKTNITDLEINNDRVLELNPVRFQWKTTGQEDIGLIAEDVAQVLDDLVKYDAEGRPDGVKYDKVSLYLLKVVKDLKSENESLKQRLDALEKKIENIERRDSVVMKEAQQ
jgi:hypothetical protein